MKPITKISLAVAVVVVGLGLLAKSAVDDIKTASAAYLYGYPLLIMEETRKGTVVVTGSNVIAHNTTFPDSNFRIVVRPNVDTLYSNAWFDLSEGPQVISMPATGDRYYVLPFMDAWTNVFERRGTSTSGNGAQEILLVGPDFTGELPEGISSVVESPTNMVWMVGRIQTNNQADVAAVAEIQKQMSITQLATWQRGERSPASTSGLNDAEPADPVSLIESMDAQTFFSYLNRMMAEQPPLSFDTPELAKFAHLNIAPGADFQLSELGFIQRWAVAKALEITRAKINDALKTLNMTDEGWNIAPNSIGNYDTDYTIRTVVAKVGLGALPPQEASYPSTTYQADGEKYDGSKFNYRLHFAADELPPVDAFWSLTIYDFEGYMKHNEIDRFSIGDRSDLQFNDNGSLDIYIQHQRPEQSVSNWLPAPAEEFNLVLRMYLPHERFLDGEWTPPALDIVKTP